MTPERFQTIVEAYGADPRRWPAGERKAALEWAASHRVEADTLMAESVSLDAMLDASRVAPPQPSLIEHIVAGAPRPNRWMFWRFPRARWPGFAVAGVGVGLVGGIAGAFAVSFFLLTAAQTATVHDTSYMTTAFGGPTSEWSDE